MNRVHLLNHIESCYTRILAQLSKVFCFRTSTEKISPTLSLKLAKFSFLVPGHAPETLFYPLTIMKFNFKSYIPGSLPDFLPVNKVVGVLEEVADYTQGLFNLTNFMHTNL